MTEDTALLRDPAFQKLLSQRSRWRWGLSGFVICTYFAYALGGLYFPGAYAKSVGNSAVPWGIVLGLLLIGLSIVLSLLYVRVVNRLPIFTRSGKAADR